MEVSDDTSQCLEILLNCLISLLFCKINIQLVLFVSLGASGSRKSDVHFLQQLPAIQGNTIIIFYSSIYKCYAMYSNTKFSIWANCVIVA